MVIDLHSDEAIQTNYELSETAIPYWFRYTFPYQTKQTIEDPSRNFTQEYTRIYKNICEIISKHADEMTCGVEFKNSKGNPTYIHMHIHFTSKVIKDTIRKAITRYLTLGSYPASGVKTISLKPKYPRSKDELFMYPLKQYSQPLTEKSMSYVFSKGFTLNQLNELRKLAYNQYIKICEINSAKSDNSDILDTLFDRAISKCEKAHSNQKVALRDIQVVLINLYVEEKRPINITTIQGYALNIGYRLGVIDINYILEKMV